LLVFGRLFLLLLELSDLGQAGLVGEHALLLGLHLALRDEALNDLAEDGDGLVDEHDDEADDDEDQEQRGDDVFRVVENSRARQENVT
jgi:hypothetical protein